MSIFKLSVEDILKDKKLYNIWLAGLGAYAKSSEEMDQLSDKSKNLFDDLVERGRAIESHTKERLHTEQSHASVAVEERVQQTLQKFVGLDNDRLDHMDDKIDELTNNIEVLLARQHAKEKPETKKVAAKAKAKTPSSDEEELDTQK